MQTHPQGSSSIRFVGVAAAVLLVTYLVSVIALKVLAPEGTGRLALALLPLGGFVLFIVAEVRLIRSLDEMQQRVQLEALAIAYPTAILLVFGLGFLERAGCEVPGFERLRDVWPLTVLPYWLGLALAWRRYR